MGLFHRKHQATATATVIDRATPVIEPGVPGRCPQCDGFGYVEHIDLNANWQAQHCRDCGYRWEYQFDDAGHLLDVTVSSVSPQVMADIDLIDDDTTGHVTPGEWVRTEIR